MFSFIKFSFPLLVVLSICSFRHHNHIVCLDKDSEPLSFIKHPKRKDIHRHWAPLMNFDINESILIYMNSLPMLILQNQQLECRLGLDLFLAAARGYWIPRTKIYYWRRYRHEQRFHQMWRFGDELPTYQQNQTFQEAEDLRQAKMKQEAALSIASSHFSSSVCLPAIKNRVIRDPTTTQECIQNLFLNKAILFGFKMISLSGGGRGVRGRGGVPKLRV